MIFDMTAGSGEPYKVLTLNDAFPADVTVEFNKEVTCKVEIATHGKPEQYTYQWFKNGSAVEGANGDTYTFTPNEVGTITLECDVTNAAGTVTSRTATITSTEVYLFKDGTFHPDYYNESLAWASINYWLLDGVKMNIQDKKTRKFNAMDITHVNTVTATITGSWGGNFNLVLFTTDGAEAAKVSGKTVGQVLTLDISSFEGQYAVGFYATSGHVEGEFNVNVNPIAIYP
jgi:hypothetical protein